jgi:uncharacterized protein (DUF1778 family)
MPAAKRRVPKPEAGKPARFNARLTRDQKMLFERAAAISGRSLTDFVIGAANEVASRTIRDHEVLTLSVRNSRALVEALLNPPRPNRALREAFRLHKASVRPDERS